jgi:hypothetical protein
MTQGSSLVLESGFVLSELLSSHLIVQFSTLLPKAGRGRGGSLCLLCCGRLAAINSFHAVAVVIKPLISVCAENTVSVEGLSEHDKRMIYLLSTPSLPPFLPFSTVPRSSSSTTPQKFLSSFPSLGR